MHTTRRSHRLLLIVAIAALLSSSACGAGRVASSAQSPPPDPAPSSPAAPVALLSTETGIAAVTRGTTDVRWSAAGAAAALDGSAVFARGSGTLVRLDPASGRELRSWPVDAALNPVVVAPDGRWVALTDHGAYEPSDPPSASTRLVVIDGRNGTTRARFDLTGDVEPEAFSPDGDRLVVLDHRGSVYRVDTLDLDTGARSPTIDENKDEVGDMAGQRVRGVLSADRRLLATLYQTPGGPEPGAFVHVLNLDGWTYCVGLPSAFGSGPDGSVVIERHEDAIVVISEHADQRAQFSLNDLESSGSAALHVEVNAGAGVRADAPYRTLPGFRALIAVSPTTASAPASPSSAGAPGSRPAADGS